MSFSSALPVPKTASRGKLAVLALACLLASAASGQGFVPQQKATLEVSPPAAVAPGGLLVLEAQVEIEDHWHVNSNTPSIEGLVATELSLDLPEGWPEPTVTYPEHKLQKFPYFDDPIAVYEGKLALRAEVTVPEDTPEGRLSLPVSFFYQACDDKQCLQPTTRRAQVEVTIDSGATGATSAATAGASSGSATAGAAPAIGGQGLFAMLLAGLLGGLILNAMPCVLPVLSLKVFGLVKSAADGRAHVVRGALATALGILASFAALAAVAVLARAAGAAVGWGVQFQQPGFVVFLAVVVLLFSLNMWGLFEIPLPQSLARVGGGAQKEGLAGHFASGLFATLMATPCSAPFLGTAVGFALAQKAPTIFAIFLAVGTGMALPYLLLALFPGAAKLLPKPGQWMVTLRGVMGFLLAGSAVWLFYVLGAQVSPERLAFVQIVLLTLSLFIWLASKSAPSTGGRRLWSALALAAAIGSIILASGGAAPAAAAGEMAGKLINWVPFDEALAEELSQEGALVFVDVTANWCLTCKANERGIIETQTVAQAFKDHQVITMKADWTNPNPKILAFLNKYGSSSIPFYILYRPGRDPFVFGQILTQDSILGALEEASAIATNSL